MMVDPQNMHSALRLDDLIDDAIGPPTSSPRSLQLAAQLLAHPFWILDQGPEHELDDSRGCLLGEAR